MSDWAVGGGEIDRGSYPGLPEIDVLRLAVVPVPEVGAGEFAVEIYVNEVEMSAAGAGLGMDPVDVLVPRNRFIATDDPNRIPAARCGCGVYGCRVTDLVIQREGDVVHWDWEVERPVKRRMTFDAAAYDREVARIGADASWETPSRTASRLVATGVDAGALAARGLRYGWSGTRWNDPVHFDVSLYHLEAVQVFIAFPWDGRTAEQLAAAVLGLLGKPPEEWPGWWSEMQPGASAPPFAGPGWQHRSYH